MRFNFFKKGASVALDLGNNNTLLIDAANNYISEPSYIALSKVNKTIRAAGREAYDMLGRTNKGYEVIKPLKGGIIADYEAARKMLHTLVRRAYPKSSSIYSFNRMVCGIPFSSTEVERRALRDALEQFRARKTVLIFEPMAAAMGMGLNVEEPDGKLIIDIGGGVTEIALISLSGIVTYQSINVAGDSFDKDIQDYCRSKYNTAIGLKQAEQLKVSIGTAMSGFTTLPDSAYVAGKEVTSGIPKRININSLELAEAVNESVTKIEEAILQSLDECPPELSGDIYTNGIYLTGGGSLLRGLKERLEEKTKLSIHQDINVLHSVTKGISYALHSENRMVGI